MFARDGCPDCPAGARDASTRDESGDPPEFAREVDCLAAEECWSHEKVRQPARTIMKRAILFSFSDAPLAVNVFIPGIAGLHFQKKLVYVAL